MERNIDGVVLSETQLSYVGQDAESIPGILGRKYGKVITRLDLSYNQLRTLKGTYCFEKLEELILDNNNLNDAVEIPSLPNLHTLTLNKNKIVNLDSLIEKITDNLPALTYLSLLGNQACPNELSCDEKDEEDYQRYRYYVIYKLPKLKFLDSRAVREDERKEAERVGAFMKVVSPSSDPSEDNSAAAVSDGFYYTPLPRNSEGGGEHHGTFGRCRYIYYGKHSEGNRFIRNSDL